MESQPKFIKDFSKAEAQSERDQLASEIKNQRKEALKGKEISEVENLSRNIENISDTLPSKIADFIAYIKIKTRLMKKEEVVVTNLSEPMEDAKIAIENFYAKQKEKWEDAPYSKEDITELFSPEHLASLSIDDYILLMKRFPAEMITHVTRQGVRDHLGAVNHHEGIDKMSNGFKDIVNDGHLKSSFAIHVTENAKRDEISNFLNLKDKTREEAYRSVDYIIGEDTQHYHGSFADIKSLHLATEEVANAHYGAETGNEIFFAYPSALIASQYVFSGQLAKASGGYHNNQWVFFNEDEGLDIDTGIVFIPRITPVDRNTGSKYDLNENFEPKRNSELCSQIEALISRDDFKQFANEYADVFGKVRFDMSGFLKTGGGDIPQKLAEALQVLEDKFSITDKRVQESVLDYSFLISLPDANCKVAERIEYIFTRLRGIGLEFEHAKDTVPSELYWEEYFDRSGKRPSKIVFYDENDPTLALKKWRTQNGLFKTESRDDFGFEENRVDLSNAEDVKTKVPSISRFKSLAHDVIDEFYN